PLTDGSSASGRYTLSLHVALPIFDAGLAEQLRQPPAGRARGLLVDDDAVIGRHGSPSSMGRAPETPGGASSARRAWRARPQLLSIQTPHVIGPATSSLSGWPAALRASFICP